MEIVLSIVNAFWDKSPLIYPIVFISGFLISLGICSVVRLPIALGYISSSTSSTKHTIIITLSFIIGLIVGYISIGVLLGTFSYLLSSLFKCQTYVYYFLGVLTFIISMYFLGFLNIKLPFRITYKPKFIESKPITIFGAFITGVLFVLLEGIVCPCCGPVIYIIATYTLLKGDIIFGISLFFVYALGQALPFFLIGIFSEILFRLKKYFYYWEYVEVTLGLFLLLLSVYFFMIA